MKLEQVTYHVVPSGGAFGRHLSHDQDVMAAQLSQRIGKPVKLQWLREEGIKHGRCRPGLHPPRQGHGRRRRRRRASSTAWPARRWTLRHGLGDVVSGYVTEYNNEGACQYLFAHTQKLAYKTGPDGASR